MVGVLAARPPAKQTPPAALLSLCAHPYYRATYYHTLHLRTSIHRRLLPVSARRAERPQPHHREVIALPCPALPPVCCRFRRLHTGSRSGTGTGTGTGAAVLGRCAITSLRANLHATLQLQPTSHNLDCSTIRLPLPLPRPLPLPLLLRCICRHALPCGAVAAPLDIDIDSALWLYSFVFPYPANHCPHTRSPWLTPIPRPRTSTPTRTPSLTAHRPLLCPPAPLQMPRCLTTPPPPPRPPPNAPRREKRPQQPPRPT